MTQEIKCGICGKTEDDDDSIEHYGFCTDCLPQAEAFVAAEQAAFTQEAGAHIMEELGKRGIEVDHINGVKVGKS